MFNTQARTAAIGNAFNTRAETTHSEYLNQSVMDHFQSRIGWMVMLALFGFISGYIITSFEDTLSSLLILAVYIPMIADSGGNSGSQAASVIIQALAKNDLHTGLYLRVLWKELRVGIMTAGVISIIAFCKVSLLSGDAALPMDTSLFEVAFVISFALAVQIVLSTLIGATIPLGASRAGINPAVMTSPMLTSVVDISGMLIYFGLATSMLNI
ncbi:magnesium transporter [Endozoicomonas montiporae]|uniref:Magnesium transporter n=1 Tax=Endozoicomonas montiporae CL-33 TaxID=570277 RepID=A0A142B9P3_9GAMM|nr:magnesium transporter [Endozoicomonas montiporae]AMO55469.1 magnesium transporter [Endozoicomonas montiporae CL-33]